MLSESQPPPRPFQFSVKHLLAVLLAFSVLLALVTQLWYVGLVAAVFLAAFTVGAWRRDARLAAAAATALLVFAVTLGAAWILFSSEEVMFDRRVSAERVHLQYLACAVEDYRRDHGEYAASIADMEEVARSSDAWGNAYAYRKVEGGFELMSFGADGKPGGTGLAADIVWPRAERRPPPRIGLSQFLFRTPISGQLVATASLAAFFAAAIWYSAQPRLRRGIAITLLSIVVTTVAAVVIAIFLAVIHVAFEQGSGH